MMLSKATFVAAYRGSSFVPEERGESHYADYHAFLERQRADWEALAAQHGTTDLLDAEWERFVAGYEKHYAAWLHARANCVSWMITGRSGLNVRRCEKMNNRERAKLDALTAWKKKATDAVEKKLNPGIRPIMAGDDDAVERLQEKIAEAVALQERYKAINKIARSKKLDEPAKREQLAALGLTEKAIDNALHPDWGLLGMPAYALTNNNANIRRMKERLAALEKTKSREDVAIDGEHARVEVAWSENRIRLFFPGKPAAEVRDRLKKAGFRWAPSQGAWSGYVNDRVWAAAREIAGITDDRLPKNNL